MTLKKQQTPPTDGGNAANAKDPSKTVDAAEAEKRAQPARDQEQARQHRKSRK